MKKLLIILILGLGIVDCNKNNSNVYAVKNVKGETFKVDEDKLLEAEKDGFFIAVSNDEDEFLVSFIDLEESKKDGFKPITLLALIAILISIISLLN